ncbi:MAG: hypothetical protein V3U67_00805 [Gemmatimonadota bacterium]
MISSARFGSACLMAATLVAGCGSSSGGLLGSPGLRSGPSNLATVTDYPQGPDSVMLVAWESLRNEGIMARSFQRAAGDSANTAAMESDWVFIPNVLATAPVGTLREQELWVKFLFWGEPERGGTRLFMDMLYDPIGPPAEPVQWARMRSVPRSSPAWSMAEYVLTDIDRRIGATD